MPRTVDDRPERHAVVVELERVGQREDLETTRIGKDDTVPVHERMQAARLGDELGSGTQEQVVGVRKHHLGVECPQLVDGDAFHRGAGTHGHECGRLDRAMRGHERAPSCGTCRVD